MSEYFTFETRATDDPDQMVILTNQPLAPDGDETYDSYEAGDEGSPIAQMLFNAVSGIRTLDLSEGTLTITRDSDVSWEEIVDDVRDALRDFFL
jgi:hypothetical protein